MEKRLFIWIGAVIFGGLLLQTFIQLEADYQLEAAGFILFSAAIYYGLFFLKKRKSNLYLGLTCALGIVSLLLVFFAPLILPVH
ncbi:hypothetical protein [Jeotgalibacillus campisalis]|uniref:Uncharacterized protein n=1 Tax=Jeotgalibacillus campisalis TaxID=220754 RepID=A0A0C2VG25_9BACL|nr:hypothetical protein [Jeotgalibacillus campisalis]KIL47842.1 hypothetical protein KR50_20090 [Jeotgalibacillus campisalis]